MAALPCSVPRCRQRRHLVKDSSCEISYNGNTRSPAWRFRMSSQHTPNSVIQKSKRHRQEESDVTKMAFNAKHTVRLGKASPLFERTDPHDGSYVSIRRGDEAGEYLVTLSVSEAARRGSGGAITTYKARVFNPPHVDTPEVRNPASWDVEFSDAHAPPPDTAMRIGTRDWIEITPVELLDPTKISKRVITLFEEAFKQICAHWFYHGR